MMSHVEWSTGIADTDEYNYDTDIASSDPGSDSPLNDDTLQRLDDFIERQIRYVAEGAPHAFSQRTGV
eukprot:4620975-Karenia_brevis.AAC.1